MQRTEYLPAPSGAYCMPAGVAGQSYFGGQPIGRPESGTSNMMPLNSGPQINPMGMVGMNGEMTPVMGAIGVTQQQNVSVMTGKKGNNKRHVGLFVVLKLKKKVLCVLSLHLRSLDELIALFAGPKLIKQSQQCRILLSRMSSYWQQDGSSGPCCHPDNNSKQWYLEWRCQCQFHPRIFMCPMVCVVVVMACQPMLYQYRSRR